jgi:hypothetical protein
MYRDRVVNGNRHRETSRELFGRPQSCARRGSVVEVVACCGVEIPVLIRPPVLSDFESGLAARTN